MGRFVRDFGFLASILLLPGGIYCLRVGTENRGPDAPFYLLAGAAFASGGFLSICCSIREFFIARSHVRYAHGKQPDRKSHGVRS
jgi:hypothetical protein